MIDSVNKTLNQYGKLGVEAIKNSVSQVSATNETVNSIRYEVSSVDNISSLIFLARKFFSLMESGRGPRKSNEESGFKDGMLKYMEARGIGADLSDKKRKQLARFLTLKINREGDATYKKGGRIIYSPIITKLIEEIKQQIKKDLIGYYIKDVLSVAKDGTISN